MNYYLHRISHHAELAYPLLERGILSIGWSDFATREFVNRHQSNGWKDVPGEIASDPEYGKTRSRFGLQRFLQMNVCDRVVIPSWGTFHVYEVVLGRPTDCCRPRPARPQDLAWPRGPKGKRSDL